MCRPINQGDSLDKMTWIRDLAQAEKQMEETGVVDVGFNSEKDVEELTLDFLRDLRLAFTETASAFNQIKGSIQGSIKIYGVSKTIADFMLFRNGSRLLFTCRGPGMIVCQLQHGGASAGLPGQAVTAETPGSTEYLKAKWGAFGELVWTHNDLPINLDYLVRFYLSRFVRESVK